MVIGREVAAMKLGGFSEIPLAPDFKSRDFTFGARSGTLRANPGFGVVWPTGDLLKKVFTATALIIVQRHPTTHFSASLETGKGSCFNSRCTSSNECDSVAQLDRAGAF